MIATILTTVGPTVFASLWVIAMLPMAAVSFGIIDD